MSRRTSASRATRRLQHAPLVMKQLMVRPDLAAAPVQYYPVIELFRCAALNDLCTALNVTPDFIRSYCNRAALELSTMVVIDRLALGEPEGGIRAVLVPLADGGWVLCAGLFAEMNTDRAAVEATVREFAAEPGFHGAFLGIGEVRANPQRVPS